jgi:hypothetical protein
MCERAITASFVAFSARFDPSTTNTKCEFESQNLCAIFLTRPGQAHKWPGDGKLARRIHQTTYLHLVKIRTLSFVTKSMSKSKGSNYAVEDCQEGDC